MKSKIYKLPLVGDILVCKHHNSKQLSIKLRHGEMPKVVIPRLMPYDMGFRFATEKEHWILEHAKKLEEKKTTSTLIDDNAVLKTRFHSISFGRHKHANAVSKKNGNAITVYFAELANLKSDENQKLIKGFVTQVLRNEAKEYLPKRIELLAKNFGFDYNKVTVKNLKSRWGSCSARNNINLNIHLMRLPEYLSDFIILHELCHTVHKNHGPHFHTLLNTLCGNESALNKELKKYSTQF